MKKVVLIVVIVIVILVALGVGYFLIHKPDLSQYEKLNDPTITEMPDQNMLVVEAKGDPNASAGEAIKTLYKTYFSLPGVPKSVNMTAPRSRWSVSLDTPKEQWVGFFGLPIPMSVKTIPPDKEGGAPKAFLALWKYGTVAEILHKGPYDKEEPTVQRLKDYVTQQGYKIVGDHEEDYVKGPGMFGKGKPDEYLTVIRYQVEKIK